jgi:hypothetical protein
MNSAAMNQAHYKGLAAKAHAEKWFTVLPARAQNIIQFPGTKLPGL